MKASEGTRSTTRPLEPGSSGPSNGDVRDRSASSLTPSCLVAPLPMPQAKNRFEPMSASNSCWPFCSPCQRTMESAIGIIPDPPLVARLLAGLALVLRERAPAHPVWPVRQRLVRTWWRSCPA